MKKALLVGLAMATALIPSAMAIEVKTGGSWGPYQTGSGGEFTLTAVGLDLSDYSASAAGFNNDIGGDTFQTFCLENSAPPENIYQNTTYIATINTAAVKGGTGTMAGDTLSVGTGWLYSQFALGTLPGYNYGGGRTVSAGALQNTIWWLEGEGGVAYSAYNPFMVAVLEEFDTEDSAKADGASEYGVYALNLLWGEARCGQDQLYYNVPDAGGTLMLLGLGLASIAFYSRRRN